MANSGYYQIDFTKEDLGLSTYALAKQTDVESIMVLSDVELEKINDEISINGNTVNTINISDIVDNDIVQIKLVDIKSGNTIIKDLTASTMFKY